MDFSSFQELLELYYRRTERSSKVKSVPITFYIFFIELFTFQESSIGHWNLLYARNSRLRSNKCRILHHIVTNGDSGFESSSCNIC